MRSGVKGMNVVSDLPASVQATTITETMTRARGGTLSQIRSGLTAASTRMDTSEGIQSAT